MAFVVLAETIDGEFFLVGAVAGAVTPGQVDSLGAEQAGSWDAEVAALSSDESEVATSARKRSRTRTDVGVPSAATPFVELNTEEKLITVMTVLERIEYKLDHALLLQ